VLRARLHDGGYVFERRQLRIVVVGFAFGTEALTYAMIRQSQKLESIHRPRSGWSAK